MLTVLSSRTRPPNDGEGDCLKRRHGGDFLKFLPVPEYALAHACCCCLLPQEKGLEWETFFERLKKNGQWHVEVY